jgi:hypothetical protein
MSSIYEYKPMPVEQMVELLNNLETIAANGPKTPLFTDALHNIRLVRETLPHIDPAAQNSVEILPFTGIALQRKQIYNFAELADKEPRAPDTLSENFTKSADNSLESVAAFLAKNPETCLYENFEKIFLFDDIKEIADLIKKRGLAPATAVSAQEPLILSHDHS